jgi:hypothetical protein
MRDLRVVRVLPGLPRHRNKQYARTDIGNRAGIGCERGMTTTTSATRTSSTASTTRRGRQPAAGVGRLVRRLERERRSWTRQPGHDGPVVPTEQAWRAGVAEGLRLAQAAIRKGV